MKFYEVQILQGRFETGRRLFFVTLGEARTCQQKLATPAAATVKKVPDRRFRRGYRIEELAPHRPGMTSVLYEIECVPPTTVRELVDWLTDGPRIVARPIRDGLVAAST